MKTIIQILIRKLSVYSFFIFLPILSHPKLSMFLYVLFYLSCLFMRLRMGIAVEGAFSMLYGVPSISEAVAEVPPAPLSPYPDEEKLPVKVVQKEPSREDKVFALFGLPLWSCIMCRVIAYILGDRSTLWEIVVEFFTGE